MGIENSALDVCSEHRMPPERRVAFEGFETGRRFLVCAQPQPQNCGFVGWVDPEWPHTMQNALLKLWEMLEDNKSARRDDNLENSLKNHQLTEEKRNLDANYDKLVEDVNQLFNAQEERVMDLSYLKDKMNAHGAESSSDVVAVMKTEIEKKEAEIMEFKGKYSVLMNLAEAQGRVIRTQKANHLKEKEKLSEENYNLKVQVDKLTNSEEKLNDDIVVLNIHIDGLKKGIENLIKRGDELKLQIADQLMALEKNQEKLKMIRDILDG
uniref:GRF-type domain-containing protein n=1 Tax=Hordeum vulgare subsp. vulgare TaxID=112509 RepID=A0A8I7BCT8_HORVV